MTQHYNFPDHKSGDTFGGVQFELLVNGSAKSLVGAIINMTVAGETLSSSTGEIVISDAAGGKFNVKSQIIDFTPDNYAYEIVIIFSDGSIKTYIDGWWRIID
jgi:hypothetical protein